MALPDRIKPLPAVCYPKERMFAGLFEGDDTGPRMDGKADKNQGIC
tara:strand:+ start:405 stop:542 length:138 start_codon:yes stop_codon:yes gene_type:complete